MWIQLDTSGTEQKGRRIFVRVKPKVIVYNAVDTRDREEVRAKGRHHKADPPALFSAPAPDLSDGKGNRGCENPTHQRA